MTSSGGPEAQKTDWHIALLGGYDKRGTWEVPSRTIAVSPVGGVDVDLTQATIPDAGATIIKISLVGGMKAKVPADLNVVVEGWNLIGRRPSETGPHVPGAPTVTLHAYGIFGGVKVERAPSA